MHLKLLTFPNSFAALSRSASLSQANSQKSVADSFARISKDLGNIWSYLNFNKNVFDDIEGIPSRATYGLNGTNLLVYSPIGNSGVSFLDTEFYNEDEDRPQTIYEALIYLKENSGGGGGPVGPHDHNDLYYTEAEVDALLSPIEADIVTIETNITNIQGDINNIEQSIENVETSISQLSLTDLDDVIITSATTGQTVEFNGTNWVNVAKPDIQIGGSWFNAGSIIEETDANIIYVRVPCDGTISRWTILTDGGSGSCQIDVWKKAFVNYPPTVADTIINTGLGGVKPNISSGIKGTDSVLANWSTAVLSTDVLALKLETLTAFTYVSIFINITPN